MTKQEKINILANAIISDGAEYNLVTEEEYEEGERNYHSCIFCSRHFKDGEEVIKNQCIAEQMKHHKDCAVVKALEWRTEK